MKEVTIKNVSIRIAELETVRSLGELSLRGEFELACLLQLVASQERIAELEENDREQMAELYRRNATIHRLQQQAEPVSGSIVAAAQKLVKRYIANAGTECEFIACWTPERSSIGAGGVWDEWKALEAALNGQPAEPATDNTAQQFEALAGANNDKLKPFTVVLPKLINVLYRDDFSKPYDTLYAYRASDVIDAIGAAGGDVTTSAGSGKHGT